MNSTRLALLPELVRAPTASTQQRQAIGASGGLLSIVMIWTVLASLLPDSAGRELYGASWVLAEPLIVFFGIQYVGLSIASGAFLGLRATQRAAEGLRVRAALSVTAVLVGLITAITCGTRAIAIGQAVVACVGACLYWLQYRRVMVTRPFVPAIPNDESAIGPSRSEAF